MNSSSPGGGGAGGIPPRAVGPTLRRTASVTTAAVVNPTSVLQPHAHSAFGVGDVARPAYNISAAANWAALSGANGAGGGVSDVASILRHPFYSSRGIDSSPGSSAASTSSLQSPTFNYNPTAIGGASTADGAAARLLGSPAVGAQQAAMAVLQQQQHQQQVMHVYQQAYLRQLQHGYSHHHHINPSHLATNYLDPGIRSRAVAASYMAAAQAATNLPQSSAATQMPPPMPPPTQPSMERSHSDSEPLNRFATRFNIHVPPQPHHLPTTTVGRLHPSAHHHLPASAQQRLHTSPSLGAALDMMQSSATQQQRGGGPGMTVGESRHQTMNASPSDSISAGGARLPLQPYYPSHFMKGTMIQLSSGELKRVEELNTDDFIGSATASRHLKMDSSTVVRIEDKTKDTVLICFSVGEHKVQVSVQATVEHPFFVIGQGWSSCSPHRSRSLYGLTCSKLQVGDVCISLTHKDPTPTATPTSAAGGGGSTQRPRPPIGGPNAAGGGVQQPQSVPLRSTSLLRQPMKAEEGLLLNERKSAPLQPPGTGVESNNRKRRLSCS